MWKEPQMQLFHCLTWLVGEAERTDLCWTKRTRSSHGRLLCFEVGLRLLNADDSARVVAVAYRLASNTK